MPDLRLFFFGAPHIVCDGQPLHVDTRKATALLAYLALAGRPCRRESLICLLWPDADPEHGRGVLRRTLSVLHSALVCDGLAIERETVSLGGVAWCDVTEFQRLLAASRAGNGSPAGLAEAAALYRDDFLSGFSLGDSLEFDDWQREQAGHLRSELSWALERLVQGYTAQGQFEAALGAARRWLSLDRLNEAAHCQLMRLYAWSGQRSLALRQYAECQAMLRQELDAAPQADTTALYTAIKENRLPAPQPLVETQNFASLSPAPRLAGKRFATLLAVETQPQAHLSIEEQAARAQDFHAAARVCLAAYGGQIVTIPGDRWLAVFGSLAAHESDPEMALRAALALQPEAGRLGLALSIGAATGEVYHQPEAIRPVGAAVRLAQTLAMQARPGEILASEATYRLTRGAFAFSPQALSIRNGSEPVNAYRVAALLPLPQKAGGLNAQQVQMIGRETEFSHLLEAFHRLEAGEGQIVTIAGEAGVGKSRLIDELRRATAGGARWLEGRCLEWGRPASYWPFVDMLHTFFGESGRVVESVLQDMFAVGSLSASRAAEIGVLIAQLHSAGESRAVDAAGVDAGSIEHLRQQTFLALRDFFLALARQRPVVLVFEDLHWADPLSLDLIGLLIESLPLGPLLLACVYRPEREHRCLRLARIAAHKCPQRYTDLYLRELTYGQSQALLDAFGRGEIPGRTKESILERTQGNPFFIEEMARSLLEGGGLPGEAPASVQSVIRSRLDRLVASDRQVLEAASVIGQIFRRRVLQQMVGQEIDPALLALEERGLIYPERSIPEEEYAFKHVLTQEAVYGGMLQPQRVALHRQAAEALETLYADRLAEYAEPLSYHYEQCGDLPRAAGFLLEAGRKALRAYDNEIAIAHLRHGLGLLEGMPATPERDRQELELLVTLGVPVVLVRGHGASEVGTVYERARQIGDGLGESPHRFQVLMGLRRYYFHHGSLLEAFKLGEEMTSAAGDLLELARAYMMQGEVLLAQGEFWQARECLESGLVLDDPGQSGSQVLSYGNDTSIGLRMFDIQVKWMLGYPDQARIEAERLLERATALGHPFSLACALFWTALLSLLLGDVRTVQEQAEAIRTISAEHSFVLYGGSALTLQGWVLVEAGQIEDGMALMHRGLGELQNARTIPFYTGGWAFLAEACGKAGKIQDGLEAIGEAEAYAAQTGAYSWQAEHLRLKGELLQQAGASPSEVEACYRQALDLARSQAAKSWELRIATSAARFLCDQGREAEARHLLGEVYSWFTEGFETADLSRAKALLQDLALE